MLQLISYKTKLSLGKFKTSETIFKWRRAKIRGEKKQAYSSSGMINHVEKKTNDIFGLERCKISTRDNVCNLMIHSDFDS